nr:hypothetical protein GCM10020185_57860 [Pseudomonas brassicacearum subsp. brassicacearum]
MADQMPSRVQARIQLPTLRIHADRSRAQGHRTVDVMDDLWPFLDHAQHLAFTDPSGVAGLTATLGVEQRGVQHHGKLMVPGAAIQDFRVGLEVIAMEKKRRSVMCHTHIRNCDGIIDRA